MLRSVGRCLGEGSAVFDEEWYDWVGVEDCPDYVVNPLGDVADADTLTPKPSHYDEQGYVRVSLHGRAYGVHVLVAQAFVPGRTPERWQVNHKDGVKDHNHHSNLEWVTPQENIDHVFESGIRQRKRR